MPTDPLLDRLRQLSWPEVTLDRPDPSPGQLWRAVWAEVACLIVVIDPSAGRRVRAVAASADPIGDDHTVVASTAGEMTVAVWADVTAYVKTFTLEHRVTDLTERSLVAVGSAMTGHLRGVWPAINDGLDDRALLKAELHGRITALADAEWRPMAGRGPSLAELARAAQLSPSDLAQALGITPGDARRLVQGKREATVTELDLLAGLLGAAPSGGATFDEDLVVDLDRPEFRPRLRAIAGAEHGGDEAAARRSIAGQLMALAARHREPGRRNWQALIREHLYEG